MAKQTTAYRAKKGLGVIFQLLKEYSNNLNHGLIPKNEYIWYDPQHIRTPKNVDIKQTPFTK